MAIINMQGKYNIRIKGLKINGTTYPIIEVYFNLGNALNLGDELNFGTLEEWGYDLQIRLNTIGDSWDFMVTAGIIGESSLSFLPIDETDSTTNIRLVQTVDYGTGYFTAYPIFKVGEYALGFSYSVPIYSSDYREWYSPIIVLHDEYSDKLILLSMSARGPIFCNGSPQEPNDIILKAEGVPVTNQFPIVYSSSYSGMIFVTGFIDNTLETVNSSDSDPYNPNGEPAGGGGENQNSDEMQDETLPTISASDTGFVTLYKPSISQMNALASYMWGTLDLEVFKKIFANPMDVILGLSILPGIVPSGGSSTVKVGNIDTGISMTKVGNQYVKFNCGSVSIKKKWGAFLDYSPYTKAFIYLPFIGVQPIDADEIMGKTVSVTYNIDVLSGGCCAFIKVDNTTLYSYIGQCACSVPVTSRDWSTMINGVLGAVSSVTGTIGNIASGNIAGAISGVASVAQNVMGAKPSYQRSGSMGGMGGMMGIKTPYIIIERPVQAVPGYQNQIIGYPSFITRLIGNFKGYTEIEQCHLENIPCTKDELNEIESILKSGVIL